MSLWRQLARGLRVPGNRKAADREIADEVSHYLEEATSALMATGLTPDEARLEMGNAIAVREQVRGYDWENIVDTFWLPTCPTFLLLYPPRYVTNTFVPVTTR